jgi:hypothetical protein
VQLWPMTKRVSVSCKVGAPTSASREVTGLGVHAAIDQGQFEARIGLGANGIWRLECEGRALGALQFIKQVPDLPELAIAAGSMIGSARGETDVSLAAEADGSPSNGFSLTLRPGRCVTRLQSADLALQNRRIVLPSQTMLTAICQHARVAASGFERAALDLSWDMHDAPCLLEVGDRSVSLLARDLRSGEIAAHVDTEGRLSLSGEREGLYGIRYFNALLNPAADPAHWLQILSSEEAIGHVYSALELLSPELASTMVLVRDVVLGVRSIARRAGVAELRNFIPRPAMARFMSLVLAGNESYAERIATQIRNVTEARGLDVVEVKNILREHFDVFDVDYEIAGFVRWLDGLLRPIGPRPAEPPGPLQPLAAQYANELKDLPSAADVVRIVDSGPISSAFGATLCRLAVLLREEQLAYVISRRSDEMHAQHLQWLRYVHAVKLRVARIAQAYGGLEYALQGLVIASFLGEVLSTVIDPAHLPDEAWVRTDRWPPACALGPQEVATLLKAGLALDRQARRTQINNRMIIDLLSQRPADFALHVLIELGQDSPKALAAVLFAFLDQEQHHMQQKVDLPGTARKQVGYEYSAARGLHGGRETRSGQLL